MIPRIKHIEPRENFTLYIIFDDDKSVIYDVKDDINTLPSYHTLMTEQGLFNNIQLDKSRTCVFWNDDINLLSDILYEYGTPYLTPSPES